MGGGRRGAELGAVHANTYDHIHMMKYLFVVISSHCSLFLLEILDWFSTNV